MPVYEYECAKCGKKFSVEMTITKHAKKKVRCPKCDSARVDRRISMFFAQTSKKS